MAKGKTPKNIVDYSLYLLDFRPRSVKEMRQALRKKEFEKEEIDKTIEKLLDWGYLNDDNFKEFFIRYYKRQNVKGRYWIAHELREKGITNLDDLEDFYSDEEEVALVNKLLERWHRWGQPVAKEKYYRRLKTRGFSSSAIWDGLNALEEQEQFYEEDHGLNEEDQL